MLEKRNIMQSNGLYDYNVFIIKKYGEVYKLIKMVACKKIGLENTDSINNESYDYKLDNSIARSRSIIKEYALCNDWRYFVTLTIDKCKYDRYNLKLYVKDLSRFILNYNRYCNDLEKIKYILIPEQHKDGAWHMHGLINGIKQKDINKNKNGYLDFKKYSEKFGYMSLGKIKDKNKVSSYITKYISKNMFNTKIEKNSHLYYCSKGLKKAEVLYHGTDYHVQPNFDWHYQSKDGFCCVKNYTNLLSLQNDIISY